MSRFGEVAEPWWDDRDLYVVGGGPSLRGRDLSRLRERGRVLGVNRAADAVPCDATFTIDQNFARRRAGSLAAWAAAGQEVFLAMHPEWFSSGNAPIPGATYLRRVPGRGVDADSGTIANGLNSGYGAVCLAVKKRARRIFLLGFDLVEPGHWHDGYSWDHGRSRHYFARWAARFRDIAATLPAGVEVLNCNTRSAVDAFPRLRYEEVGL